MYERGMRASFSLTCSQPTRGVLLRVGRWTHSSRAWKALYAMQRAMRRASRNSWATKTDLFNYKKSPPEHKIVLWLGSQDVFYLCLRVGPIVSVEIVPEQNKNKDIFVTFVNAVLCWWSVSLPHVLWWWTRNDEFRFFETQADVNCKIWIMIANFPPPSPPKRDSSLEIWVTKLVSN